MRLAALTFLLAAAGASAAQAPPPAAPVAEAPDAASAEAAVERLVRAGFEKDWPTVARFMDPETAAAVAHDARFGFVGEDVSADSLLALAAAADAGTLSTDEPGSDADWHAMARVYRWAASLDGDPTDAAVVARVLDAVDRCDREHTLDLGSVLYKPVGASAAGPTAVDVVGRFYAVGPDGQAVPGESILAVTPVVWEEGRWTVDEQDTDYRQAPSTKDVSLNPIVRFLTWSQTQWGYAIAYTVPSDGCLDASGRSGGGE